ncbi:MAG: MBOAT family O-acyltransferase, partial [Maioricimonas sp. JB049]
VVESGSQALLVLERAFGYRAPPIINQVWRARTPAEFWIRFNQRVQQWLYLNAFVPAGGRRRRVVGVVAVFLVSGLFHEIFFAIATRRLDGYQFTFFLLQAPAVLASPLLDRMAARGTAGRVACHVTTWLWFAVTSPFFFHAADRVFEFFYASQPWLP